MELKEELKNQVEFRQSVRIKSVSMKLRKSKDIVEFSFPWLILPESSTNLRNVYLEVCVNFIFLRVPNFNP